MKAAGDEPRIVLAASPREWAAQLHRYVADHGGARVRATVLHGAEALDEAHDVFIGDDCTSFLTRRLVDDLHQRGRAVLGVFDPADPAGKGELIDIGVDEVIPRDASPAAFVTAVTQLATSLEPVEHRATAPIAGLVSRPQSHPRARLIAVGGPPGGGGATEVSIALTRALSRRSLRVALVDADPDAAAVAQRLGLPAWPNLRSAVDAVEHGAGELGRALAGLEGGRGVVLPGLASSGAWADLRAPEVLAVIDRLGQRADVLLVDIGRDVEDLPTASGAPRWGVARALLAAADVIVAVGSATPVAITRLLRWRATVRDAAPTVPVATAINRVPGRRFDRAEVLEEVAAVTGEVPWLLPEDRNVARAAWAGHPVRSGPFARAADRLARHLLASTRPTPGREHALSRNAAS